VLDEREPLTESSDASSLARPKGALSFRDVTFRHGACGPAVLNGVTFHVEAGAVVALVGPSGSGKSTLLALVSRLYDLPEGGGTILLDGLSVRAIRIPDLKRAVALVPQRPIILKGTIRSNLLYLAPEAGDERIREVLQAVALSATIESFPLGLDTPVGDRGQTLSGGQRQRLALAQALLADPAVLLLDNCLSALDGEAEAKVWKSLKTLLRGRTCLIVSHRFATLNQADWIVVLERGRVVQMNTPGELASRRRFLGRTGAPHVNT
jgi:ABC-type multidrug transport system fused ATPase/permease subunit